MMQYHVTNEWTKHEWNLS